MYMYGGLDAISSALMLCLVLISMPDVDSFMIVFFVSCIFLIAFLFLAILLLPLFERLCGFMLEPYDEVFHFLSILKVDC